MSGNKAVELQIQMKQNAEDLQNFMKELNNWEEEIKKKDQQLRTGNISEPPVKLSKLNIALQIRVFVC